MTSAAVAATLDRLIAMHEAVFDGQPPQQTVLRAYLDVRREDLEALKLLRASMEEWC